MLKRKWIDDDTVYRDAQHRRLKLAQGSHLHEYDSHAGSELQDGSFDQTGEPFVLVLIDGDNTLFQDHYLRQGEQGGRCAAQDLAHELARVIEQIPSITPRSKVILRLYWNLRGLTATYVRLRLGNYDSMRNFSRAFNKQRPLFECIDAGDDKESADVKIKANFELFWHIRDCKHIILAASGDRGYVGFLRQYVPTTGSVSRVTLLEGRPFHPDYASIKRRFYTARCNVFRSEGLASSVSKPEVLAPAPSLAQSRLAASVSKPEVLADTVRMAQSRPHDLAQRSADQSSTSSHSPKSLMERESLVKAPIPTDRTLQSRAVLPPVIADPILQSQAGLTPVTAGLLQSQVVSRPEVLYIQYNAQSQRIDFPIKDIQFDRNALRLRKLCNRHFLSKCQDGDCNKNHDADLTPLELQELRAFARMLPCRTLYCSDPTCVSSHQCPSHTQCRSRQDCRFGPAMHNVDTAVVRFDAFALPSLQFLPSASTKGTLEI